MGNLLAEELAFPQKQEGLLQRFSSLVCSFVLSSFSPLPLLLPFSLQLLLLVVLSSKPMNKETHTSAFNRSIADILAATC